MGLLTMAVPHAARMGQMISALTSSVATPTLTISPQRTDYHPHPHSTLLCSVITLTNVAVCRWRALAERDSPARPTPLFTSATMMKPLLGDTVVSVFTLTRWVGRGA